MKTEIVNKKRLTNQEIKYTGLCINCDKREECKIRNNEPVIWHCEEYQ